LIRSIIYIPLCSKNLKTKIIRTLHKHSFHPKNTFKGLLKLQIIRLLRIFLTRTLIRHGLFFFKLCIKEITLKDGWLMLKGKPIKVPRERKKYVPIFSLTVKDLYLLSEIHIDFSLENVFYHDWCLQFENKATWYFLKACLNFVHIALKHC